jgi:hypothetical protein
MNRLISRCLGFILVVLLVGLLVPNFIAAQGRYPPIPHTLEGRDDCLACHKTGVAGAVPIPDNHTGIKNDVCQVCHKPSIEVAPAPVPGTTPTSTGAPLIPHTLTNRENCLECHQEGDEITPQIPADHADFTSDMCRTCHQSSQEMAAQPTPTVQAAPVAPVGPIPTPIIHPQAEKGVNTCFDCHSTLPEEIQVDVANWWQRSIHAERGVTCADCHGGDPSASTKEEAKSPDAGYVGKPDRADIPALCASCHADVTLMRQYDLPTDQYAKYQESIHGLRLAEGDPNVATCADCHNGHLVLKANDPASTVYPVNVPEMCASCHADEALMAPYNIPTDQFTLYRQSVHGYALLDEQNFRAPNCATCHGTHGAAPPGFQEVANVCGSCHSATQDYYLQGAHSSASEKTPKCVTCHGRYDVSDPSEAMFLGSEPRHCGFCHEPDSRFGQTAQDLYSALNTASLAYEEAEAAIQSAREVGMLVGPLEGRLRDANTSLIIARAAQHTLNLDLVSERTDSAQAVAEEVKADAEAAVAESGFRRRAMIIAVAVIVVTIVALYLLKRELDRRLDAGTQVTQPQQIDQRP